MSKLLKATVRAHRPHIAARMTKANGYDPQKHIHAKDLRDAGIINDAELNDVDGCVDELAGSGSVKAAALKAIGEGRLDTGKANDDEFIKALMAVDSDTGPDDGDDLDGDDDGFDGDDADEDVKDGLKA